MFSKLDEVFNTPKNDAAAFVDSRTDEERAKEPSTELTTIPDASDFGEIENVPTLSPDEKTDADMEKARDTFYDLLKKGTTAMDGILHVAAESEHPRAYEVAAQMLKAMSEISKDLVALQKAKKELEKTTPVIGKQQNNYFIGTTNDMLKQIKKQAEIVSAEIIPLEKDK